MTTRASCGLRLPSIVPGDMTISSGEMTIVLDDEDESDDAGEVAGMDGTIPGSSPLPTRLERRRPAAEAHTAIDAGEAEACDEVEVEVCTHGDSEDGVAPGAGEEDEQLYAEGDEQLCFCHAPDAEPQSGL